MKRAALLSCLVLSALTALGVLQSQAAAPAPAPDGQDFSAIGEAVVRLFETRDAKKFAQEWAPSLKDWKSVQSTNAPDAVKGKDALGSAHQRMLGSQRRQLQESAQRLLDLASELGLKDPHFQIKSIPTPSFGKYKDGRVLAENETLPWTQGLEITLTGGPAPGTGADEKLRGDYRLVISGGLKFPAGWRFYEGISWKSFPAGVGSEKQLAKMTLTSRLARPGPLSLADDPALGQLGEAIVHLLRNRDEKIFATEALRGMDETWAELKKQAGSDGPPRGEFEKAFSNFQGEILKSAQGVLEQANNLGIDLSGVDIRLADVNVKMVYQRGAPGTFEDVSANQIKFKLTVSSDRQTKAGKPMAGDYVVSATRGRRNAERWFVEDKIRWEKFPDGLLGEKELADFAFENYVSENGTLPPGHSAPTIEFVRVDGEAKSMLADYRGKVVLLEFWATWCGPCQEPMAKMQKLRQLHPEWQDKVEIVSLSIDDEIALPRKHLAERGWTNTVNFWAGPGGWNATPARQFRVRGVPTCYLIDTEGKVVMAGHPMALEMQLPNLVKGLLKP